MSMSTSPVTKYASVFNIGLQNTFVYRWNYFLRALFGLIPLAGTVFLWAAVFKERGGGLHGYDYASILPFKTASIARPDAWNAWMDGPLVRLRSLVRELKRLPGERILLVGHCAIFHVLRCYLLGQERMDVDYQTAEREIILRNTAMGCFSFDPRGTGHELISWNETPHLDHNELAARFTL